MPPAEEPSSEESATPGAGVIRVRTFQAVRDTDGVLRVAAQSPEAAAWSRESYEKLGAGAQTLALLAEAESDLGVVGFFIARSVAMEAEILNLAVLPAFRRSGCATALLNAALRELARQGVRTVYLEVRQSNAAAIAFYTRNGFQKSGLRRGYYRTPDEPALTMTKALATSPAESA